MKDVNQEIRDILDILGRAKVNSSKIRESIDLVDECTGSLMADGSGTSIAHLIEQYSNRVHEDLGDAVTRLRVLLKDEQICLLDGKDCSDCNDEKCGARAEKDGRYEQISMIEMSKYICAGTGVECNVESACRPGLCSDRILAKV